jgi:hypothetical protein
VLWAGDAASPCSKNIVKKGTLTDGLATRTIVLVSSEAYEIPNLDGLFLKNDKLSKTLNGLTAFCENTVMALSRSYRHYFCDIDRPVHKGIVWVHFWPRV